MTPLRGDDFVAFYKEVHDQDPFPWQIRLAHQVVATGRWPSLLDLPTGAGKTATIDVAVFHLACEASKREARRAPLRILFVIDRRIVVDAAFDRASQIAKKLGGANGGMLDAVAERLRLLAGDGAPPLDVVRLRGGVPQERDWARSPAQPLVAVSTIDQVGSRLLFRGYGVSPRMWPVHAGLVGADALWLLDEVHLSRPFEETLAAIEAGHPPDGGGFLAERPRLAPFAVARLSATPGEKSLEAFRLGAEDREHEVLRPRLEARKVATVEPVDGKLIDAFTDHALRMIAPPAASASKKRAKQSNVAASTNIARRVAVVVNRVDLARQIFEKIKSEAGEAADTFLLTGRIRPIDRDRLLGRESFGLLFAAAERVEPERPIILVATQTIEAGADLDFDALVTEIASLDSLRQRFGRLDRLGKRRDSRAMILYPKGKPPKGESARDNPWSPIARIYGDSAFATKEWLDAVGAEIDFGINAFESVLEKPENQATLESLLAPRTQAPVLMPAYADLWATTSPPPAATPEPSLFLHGPGISADIQVVWRADIDPNDDVTANTSLELCPPSALEALPVPIWAVRRWLWKEADEEAVADVPERAPTSPRDERRRGDPVLRREGEHWGSTYPDQLQPGDTIVVPCGYGGCDEFGWNPNTKQPVTDLGAQAHYHQRLKGAIRVTRLTLANAFMHERRSDGENVAAEIWRRLVAVLADAGDEIDARTMKRHLTNIHELPTAWLRLLNDRGGQRGMGGRRLRIAALKENDWSAGFVMYDERVLGPGLLDHTEEDVENGSDATTDREGSSATGVAIDLIDHLDGVERRAREFAFRVGLDGPTTKVLALAGRLHDLGKSDPRFQADLYGAAGLFRLGLAEFMIGPLRAKSDRASFFRRGQRAVPENFRHEALSVPLAAKHLEVEALDENERDLLLWLIGTHHGYGRPFFPPCFDPEPATNAEVMIDGQSLAVTAAEAPLRLDQGWFERAERLRWRYGPWELARLEAILRLADHAASAEEQRAFDRDEAASAATEAAS